MIPSGKGKGKEGKGKGNKKLPDWQCTQCNALNRHWPPTNADAHAPLQGASTSTRAHQSKVEERVIDRSTEIENLLWIVEPAYRKLTSPLRSLNPDAYDSQSVMPWFCDSELEVDEDFCNSLCDSESVRDTETEASWNSETEVSETDLAL